MTRAGYLLLLALFGAFVLGGAIAAAPQPAELGVAPSMSCEEWFAHPTETSIVRLEGCRIDLWTNSYDERLDGRGIEAAVVQVRPPGWPDEDVANGPAILLWRTTDPDILALVDRQRRILDDDAYDRWAERHQDELVRVRTLIVSISHEAGAPDWSQHVALHADSVVDDPWTAEESARSPGTRTAGSLALILGLFGLALFVVLQRRWDRRRTALMGNTEPKRF